MAAFDWTQYLIFAKELSKRSDEAALRSAISRAYYAAFNHARAYCAAKAIPVPESFEHSSHKVVWDALLNRGRTLAGAQIQGTRLKRKRHNADYESEVENISEVVQQALAESDAVFTYLAL